MKKILSAALAVLLTSSLTLPVLAATFTDISGKQYEWAQPYIEAMVKRGYITGYEDGTYRPDNDVTRLEVLALFARAMGSGEEVNKPVIELANEMYKETISKYGLTWGSDEIAFLMYRGALKASDLDLYLKGKAKDEAMPRYEAAIIITKAMGGEAEATQELGVVLDYKDAKDVPSSAIQYVWYATEKGIMQGMDDNTFSPNTSVKRSQMAVMLSRAVDKTEYKFVKAKLNALDTETKKIELKDAAGKTSTVSYTDKTVMNVLGEKTQPKDMVTGVDAVFTYSGEQLVFIDTLTNVPDQTVTGKFVGKSTINGTLRITVLPNGETKSVTYECIEDVSIFYNGSPASITTFVTNAPITLELSGGKVVAIKGENKTITISNATVEAIEIEPDCTVTISHADEQYDGKTYPISSEAIVFKNGTETDFSNIYKGDVVTLTLEYGEVTKVTATTSSKTVEGTIQQINIATQPSIVVKVDGKSMEYAVTNSVEIIINDEKATLYDFRVGDVVKITTENQAVKKIVAVSSQTQSKNVTGVVTAINSAFNFIKVQAVGGEEITAYCKDTSTTFLTSDGKTKKMKDVEVGQTVTIIGNESNGAFSATVVVIEAGSDK